MLESRFQLSHHGTTPRTELVAGSTTFLTMAYIAFVNPAILSQAGMDFGAVFVATCLGAAIGSATMGLVANYPIALGPGMGLNAYFTYGVVLGLGLSWPEALGCVFLSGVLFLAVSVLPVREWLIHSIPSSLKLAISAGIGLFLGIIALRNAGIVVDHPETLVSVGDLLRPEPMLAIGGFALIIGLEQRRVPGAILLGILTCTAVAVAIGIAPWHGIASLPPDPRPTLLAFDLRRALEPALLAVVFAFLFVDLFDTAGTLLGVAHGARLLDSDGRLPRLRRALLADSTATVVGSALGTSTITSYIESTAGVRAGGRTGLCALVVSAGFLLCLFLSPLAQSVPAFATAPALLLVATWMARALSELDWDDATEYAPALVTALAMPLTFSIADGIGLGFVTYAAAKLMAGRPRECPPAVAVTALLFALKLAIT
jgi:AGZA family xanthine/uracil permease-like MFS transporter